MSGLAPPVVRETTITEPGIRQALDAVDDGADVVVAVGGDGTVGEVAAALAGTGLAVGIIPTGTANLYARNVGLHGLGKALTVAVAVAGTPRPADLGRVTLTTTHGVIERVFLIVVGIGHDAHTVADVSTRGKRRAGWLAYLGPGLRRLGAPPVPLRASLDGGPWQEVHAWSVLVANTGRLPFGIEVVPGARPNDGVLHTAIVSPRTTSQWLGVAATGMRQRPARTALGLSYRRGASLRLESDIARPAHVDGDVVPDVISLQAHIEPGVLRVQTLPVRHVPEHTSRARIHQGPGPRSS